MQNTETQKKATEAICSEMALCEPDAKKSFHTASARTPKRGVRRHCTPAPAELQNPYRANPSRRPVLHAMPTASRGSIANERRGNMKCPAPPNCSESVLSGLTPSADVLQVSPWLRERTQRPSIRQGEIVARLQWRKPCKNQTKDYRQLWTTRIYLGRTRPRRNPNATPIVLR